MLPSLPYLLWEQVEHTASLRPPIFCTAPAEEHRVIWNHLFHLHFITQLSKAGSGKFGNFTCRAWWESTKHLWVPFSNPGSDTAVTLCLQHCPEPGGCSPCLPCSAHKSLGGCSSGFSVRSPDLPGTQPGCKGQVLFPSALAPLFSHALSAGQGRTEQNIALGKGVDLQPKRGKGKFPALHQFQSETSFLLLCLTKGSTASEPFCF